MFYKTVLVSAITLLFANQAMGGTIPAQERGVLIATDAYSACNCPNNCNHKEGSSCKFYGGPSDSSGVVSGTCYPPNGNPYSDIECIPK